MSASSALIGSFDFLLTAREDSAYREAGADVLAAPRLTRSEDVRSVVESADRPVNVLAWTGLPPVSELAAAGVSRSSDGGWLAFAALAALVDAPTELRSAAPTGTSTSRAAVRRPR